MQEQEISKQVLHILKNSDKKTCKQIAEILNKPEVEIRKAINELRQKYVPIIATKKGYYLSYHINDIEAQIKSLQCRINAMIQAKTGLEILLKTLTSNKYV